MTSASVSLSAAGPLGHQWFAAANSADVVDAPAAVRLLGRDVVLWRSPSGTVVAAPDRCTHSKGDLTKGEVKDGLLACPKHGWTFGDEGRCMFKPSGLPINEKAHLKAYHCAERYGVIWVALNDPTAPLIDVAADDDENYRRIHSSVSVWRSNPIQIISGLLAQTDSPFDDVTADVPFVVLGTAKADGGAEHRRLLSCAPVDNRSSLVTSVVWTNSGSPVDDEKIVAETMADLDDTRAVTESEAAPLPTVQITLDDESAAVDWKRRLLALFGHTTS